MPCLPLHIQISRTPSIFMKISQKEKLMIVYIITMLTSLIAECCVCASLERANDQLWTWNFLKAVTQGDNFSYLWKLLVTLSFLGNKTGLLKKVTLSMTWNVLFIWDFCQSEATYNFWPVFLETGKKLHCMRKVMLEKNHGIKAEL